jgi:hypothetical protein
MLRRSQALEHHGALSSANRGAGWLLALQQPDGSLQHSRRIDAYYKTPFALTVNGYNAPTERLLDFIQGTFLKPDGDLDGTGVEWFESYRIYPHAWLTIAALMRGRFELAHSLLRTLIAYHDEKTGGFFTTTDGCARRSGRQEIMTSSLAGLACLWAGRLDIARKTGPWLRNMYDVQPDISKGLYQVWDTQKGLITHFDPAQAKAFLVDASQPEQWYFQYGISAAFLSSLSAATQEKEWLSLARQFLHASQHCREDVYRRPASGKIGWGAAWCYRLSGNEEDRKIAMAVIEGLQALQNEDGSWCASGLNRDKPSPISDPDIDVTAEFTGLLGCMGLVVEVKLV